MCNTKAALRRELLSQRKLFSQKKAAPSLSLGIEALSDYDAFLRAETVFCYVSAHGEVETLHLIKELLKEKTVVVPYCTDSEGNMICSQIKSVNDLTEGRFGIPEPENPECFPKEKIDFSIVPGIAFDKEGYRLGYGKGYYDRFLCGLKTFKLGVCGKDFLLDKLPHNEYDIKMDSILTL